MKTFFLILLFGKQILLTPEAVDLSDQWQIIPLESPISAITGGAAVEIYLDLPFSIREKMKKSEAPWEIEESFFNRVKDIKVTLHSENKIVVLDQVGYGTAKDSRLIIKVYSKEMIVDLDFNKLMIKSEQPLKSVHLYWKSYLH